MNTNNVLASTVIPCYNGSLFLAEAIDSVLSQLDIYSEIIVVDDGSQDDTCRIAKSYGNRVRLIKKNNGGVASARNEGVKAAKGKYIAFLDADDRFMPEKLSLHIKFMESNERCILTHSNINVFGDTAQTKIKYRLEHYPDENVPSGSVFEQLFEWNHIITSTVVLRREAFIKAGMFNEQYKYCEDYEAWLRLSLSGDFVYINQIATEYRLHKDSLSRADYLMDIGRVKARNDAIQLPSVVNLPNYPELRKKMARFAADFGYGLYKSGHPDEARSVLKIGIKYKPYDIRLIKMYLISFLFNKNTSK